MDEEIEKFGSSLNCLNTTYSLKTLQIQVNYLLLQDLDSCAALKKDPALDINFCQVYAPKSKVSGTLEFKSPHSGPKVHPPLASEPPLEQINEAPLLKRNLGSARMLAYHMRSNSKGRIGEN